MHRQLLKLRRTAPIVIETPEGFIRIRLDENGRKSMQFELPGEVRAFIGEEKAYKNARFHSICDGCPELNWSHLAAKYDDKGRFVEAQRVQMRTIEVPHTKITKLQGAI